MANLTSWGFTLNPYDCCVANKDVDGKQLTVLWQVDDLKVSHVNPDMVTSFLTQLNNVFGKNANITVTRGKVHDYLGMTLDYTKKGKVKVIVKYKSTGEVLVTVDEVEFLGNRVYSLIVRGFADPVNGNNPISVQLLTNYIKF